MVEVASGQSNLKRWTNTLEDIVREFRAGTLTQQRVNKDVVYASWTDNSVHQLIALRNSAAIIAEVKATIAKEAAATAQELLNK